MSASPLFQPETATRERTLTKSDRLLRVFEDIHNHIYANEGLSPEQTFAEMMKVLSLKVADEKSERDRIFFIQPDEFKGPRIQEFLKRIRCLEQRTREAFVGKMKEAGPIGLKPPSLAYAVDRLQHIDLLKSSRDIKGLAFQKFVNAEHRRGRGQFFTPEQVVWLCVRFLRPAPGDRVLDPACGTGGFLSQAAHAISETHNGLPTDKEPALVGIEINPMVAATAEVRLALEGVPNGRIAAADALADWPALNHELNEALGSNCAYEGLFDIILTNPPFGSQGRLRGADVLDRFDLGHKWEQYGNEFRRTTPPQTGQVPDILFIERCLDFLKVGGRMAIVLPNGDLENSSLAYVRHYIRTRARLLAVVHLPQDTFVPFGTGVKASVLFLERTEGAEPAQRGRVFFGQITKLGYRANKNGSAVYQKDDNGRHLLDDIGEPLVDEDFSFVADQYSRFLDTGTVASSDTCFTVPAAEISGRFDLEYYKPSYRELEQFLLSHGARPLNDVAKIVKRRSPKLQSPEVEVLYIELANVNVDYSEISGGSLMKVHELPSRASFEVHAGDIITAIAGNSTGTEKHMSALVTEEYEGAVCTNGFRILQPKRGINPYYLLHYLRTPYFLQQVYRYRTGAAIPAISDDDLGRVLMYIAPAEEQRRIAQKVEESFSLRKKSRVMLKGIEPCIPKPERPSTQ